MKASPAVGSSSVARMRMGVVLPAPLGPTKPKICPVVNTKERLSPLLVRPKYFLRFCTLTRIAGHLLQDAEDDRAAPVLVRGAQPLVQGGRAGGHRPVPPR